MAELATRLRAFVASPGDTTEERSRLERVVAELNKGVGDDNGIIVDLIKWESHARPGIGTDAQDVINRQLPSPDIVIGLFWRRLGTPTPRARSGTAEELEAALESWKADRRVEVLVYFNRAPYTPNESDIEQLPRLSRFRSYLERSGLLTWEYNGPDDFEAQVRQHLTGAIRNWKATAGPQRPSGGRVGAVVHEDPEHWYEQLCYGSLTVEIDARRRSEIQALAAALTAALLERGYQSDTADRAKTVLTELAVNAGRHTSRSLAGIHIQLHARFLRRVSIAVQDCGSGFDLEAVLAKHHATLCRGGREHGLMRVSSVASELVTSESTAPWRHVVLADVQDAKVAPSTFLTHAQAIRVGIHYDDTEVYWLGRVPYFGDHFVRALQFALEHDCPHLLDLYFSGLARQRATYLGIEVIGPSDSSSPTTDAMWIEDVSKPEIVFKALERYFRSYFTRRRVLVFSEGNAPLPFDTLTGWMREYGVRFFGEDQDSALRVALEQPNDTVLE